MMTKKERVLAAFQGKPVDRVPVCVWKHVPSEFWDDDDAFAKCQLDFYKATDVDFMKLSGDKYFGWPDPVLNGIESADELYKMKPLSKDHPWIRSFVERTKKVVATLGGECYTFMLIYVPVSYLRLQTSYPIMERLIRVNPEAMKYALDVIAKSLKLLIDGLIDEAGTTGFILGADCSIHPECPDEHIRWMVEAAKNYVGKDGPGKQR